jgi:hypothetical protein
MRHFGWMAREMPLETASNRAGKQKALTADDADD